MDDPSFATVRTLSPIEISLAGRYVCAVQEKRFMFAPIQSLCSVGEDEGSADGFVVGLFEGSADGFVVGLFVGSPVGIFEGEEDFDGLAEG